MDGDLNLILQADLNCCELPFVACGSAEVSSVDQPSLLPIYVPRQILCLQCSAFPCEKLSRTRPG